MNYTKIFSPIEEIKIKGLTKTCINNLKRLNIYTVYDLFYYFPKGYENSAVYKDISSVKDNESVVLKGTIARITRKYLSKNRLMVTATLMDNSGYIDLIWFNNRYIYSNIKEGSTLLVTGKAKRSPKLQIINPSYTKSIKEDTIQKDVSLEPIYSLTKGLTQKKLRSIMKNSLDKYGDLLKENIPIDFLYDNRIMSRTSSISNIHFPSNKTALDLSIRRFTFEEIMLLEMGILEKRYIDNKKNVNRYVLDDSKKLVKEYIESLSFTLTNSQKKVITSIYSELKQGKYINRLIQGDVGSGKTIVALIIMLYMAENNYQSVLMAPTEILARQHYEKVVENFSKLNINVELLTSSIKGKKREKILEDVRQGKVNILIGTHSLLSSEVEYNNLGLAVIDEQQRFGVEQRNELRKREVLSNVIVMSATPIPRSLALTIYGDLDVSIIDEMPEGRKKILTKWIKNEEEEKKMYDFILKKINEGNQVYVVSYLIEDSAKINAASAKETFESISKKFPGKSIGLLHGKMSSIEKKEIMEKFKNGEIDVLVSTTVIEVGVDVSNANIILIKNAERFGLSTLHQLRGRVGRGNNRGYCFIESNSEKEISKKRLEVLEKETDGFKISEQDLKIRNSGEIFGVKQSGISDLVLLDIVKNIKEIEHVKEFVTKYLIEHNGKIDNDFLVKDIEYKHKVKGNL